MSDAFIYGPNRLEWTNEPNIGNRIATEIGEKLFLFYGPGSSLNGRALKIGEKLEIPIDSKYSQAMTAAIRSAIEKSFKEKGWSDARIKGNGHGAKIFLTR